MESATIPQKIDKEKIQYVLDLCCIKIPIKLISQVITFLKDNGDLAYIRTTKAKFRTVLDCDKESKLILLNENLKFEDYSARKWPGVLLNYLDQNKYDIQQRQVQIKYEDLSFAEIMSKVLPAGLQIPSGFEQIGHIVHFNLSKEQIPYQFLIGQGILDTVKSAKTVVNKTEKLHNVYRTPILQLIAGEENYESEQTEGGCKFQLNFEKVYWNTRNAHDRDRVLAYTKPGDVVLDIFCGIGPFAIRAAYQGCKVIANDLNPDCYRYLKINAKLNNVDYNLICLNDDAGKVVNDFLNINYLKENKILPQFHHFDHVYMNLPVLAMDFLGVFRGMLKKGDPSIWNTNNLPLIHVYGFVKGNTNEECEQAIITRINKYLPNLRHEDILNFQHTKNVTVKKRMYCITFRIKPEDALMEPIPVQIPNLQQDENENFEENQENLNQKNLDLTNDENLKRKTTNQIDQIEQIEKKIKNN